MGKNYKVKACVVSNPGKFRNNHEDNYLLDDGQHITSPEQKDLFGTPKPWKSSLRKRFLPRIAVNSVFAVSDGLGGHNAGEEASKLVVEQLFSMKDYIFRTPESEAIRSRFQDYVIKVNTMITTKADQNLELKGMGATLTGILLCEEGVLSFNLGDSRTYVYDGQGLVKLTTDHTEGQRLLNIGVVKPKELKLVENAKALTRYLGVDDKYFRPQADVEGPFPVKNKIWLLICSDGLTDMLSDEEISQNLFKCFSTGKLEEAADGLVEQALEDRLDRRGGIDNITVLLVEIEEYLPNVLDQMKRFLERLTKNE